MPTDSEMKRRSIKRTREDGKDVPESAVMEMMANFKLPDERLEDFFDEIRYVELPKVRPLQYSFVFVAHPRASFAVDKNFTVVPHCRRRRKSSF